MTDLVFDGELSDEAATQRFAEDIAAAVLPGDVIALEGDLGAGKTAFSRALIRALAKDANLEVPSPTFSLMQPYDVRIAVRHFDLYRMGDPEELEELGFFDGLDTALTLVEWPSRAGDAMPENQMALQLDILDGDKRSVRFFAGAQQRLRFQRSFDGRAFFQNANYVDASREHVQGDASHRAYERIGSTGKPSAIFMNAPETPAGEIVQNGKSYAELVHRAVDTKPFEAIGKLLLSNGLSAPKIYAADHDQGYMLLEDLGGESLLSKDGKPIKERYLASAEMLANWHDQAEHLGQTIPGAGGSYDIPPFDRTAFLTEVSLFPEWFVPYRSAPLIKQAKQDYLDIWSRLYDALACSQTGVILRDVHSPNLLWMDDRSGVARIGVLDFQDALWGPQLYDLASLVFDARVEISPEFRTEMLAHYNAIRRTNLETSVLNQHVSILAAQRTAKILGIFARLAVRDAKASYLAHMPRNENYLSALLESPVLEPLAKWHAVHLSQSDPRAKGQKGPD